MIGSYLALFIPLMLIAAYLRDDFAMTLIYLLLGAFAIGNWWSNKSLKQITYQRIFNSHAFLGETVNIAIKIKNAGWLPTIWLRIHESRPVAMGRSRPFEQVTSIGANDEVRYEYTLDAHKRGYYPVGPLSISTGDILGLNAPIHTEGNAEHITVYPKIIPISALRIPSRSPQGTLRHSLPLFEDPTRLFGKREYSAGDSLRRVDWKSTASSGQMQVKLFEPSIALETLIFLNLNAEDYHFRTRIDSTELGIVIASSIAFWVTGKRQSVGLYLHGKDPLAADQVPPYLAPGKGQAHLMRILEVLARAELTRETSFERTFQNQRYQLPWGTSLIVITGQASDTLLAELYQARRAGQNAILVLAGPVPFAQEIIQKAAIYGIPAISIATERDMDLWRK